MDPVTEQQFVFLIPNKQILLLGHVAMILFLFFPGYVTVTDDLKQLVRISLFGYMCQSGYTHLQRLVLRIAYAPCCYRIETDCLHRWL